MDFEARRNGDKPQAFFLVKDRLIIAQSQCTRAHKTATRHLYHIEFLNERIKQTIHQ